MQFNPYSGKVIIFYSLVHCEKDDGTDDVELHIICKIPAPYQALKKSKDNI